MKKFVCIWGDWDDLAINCYDPSTKECDDMFFCDENHYEPEDIAEINEIKPGEMWSHEYGNHKVFRLA